MISEENTPVRPLCVTQEGDNSSSFCVDGLKKSGCISDGGTRSEEQKVLESQYPIHVSNSTSTSTSIGSGVSGSSSGGGSVEHRVNIGAQINVGAIEEDDFPGARVDMFGEEEGDRMGEGEREPADKQDHSEVDIEKIQDYSEVDIEKIQECDPPIVAPDPGQPDAGRN